MSENYIDNFAIEVDTIRDLTPSQVDLAAGGASSDWTTITSLTTFVPTTEWTTVTTVSTMF